jgi:CheY-like chemotaxis protein
VKLLIVDDSVLLQERLSHLITELTGIMDIESAGDVPEAIEAIKQGNPDAVILDFHLPGGNGIDVLKAVQVKDQIPVFIVFTNNPYPRLRRYCLAAGADFFLDKSFDHNELFGLLKKLKEKIL